MNFVRTTIFLSFLLAASCANARSYSSISGLFFAWLPSRESDVAFNNTEYLHLLSDHCSAKKQVYNLINQRAYYCKLRILKDATGLDSWDFAAVDIVGKSTTAERGLYGLFTTTSPHFTAWIIRSLESYEIESLVKVIDEKSGKDGLKFGALTFSTAKAVQKPYGSKITFFVPGKFVKDGEHHEAQEHHVFVNEDNQYHYIGKIDDDPKHFIDFDGDDLPELITDEVCDGLCVSLWTIKGGSKRLLTFDSY